MKIETVEKARRLIEDIERTRKELGFIDKGGACFETVHTGGGEWVRIDGSIPISVRTIVRANVAQRLARLEAELEAL